MKERLKEIELKMNEINNKIDNIKNKYEDNKIGILTESKEI